MKAERKKTVYFLSGIGTWQSGNLFGGAMSYIEKKYGEEGITVRTADFYPYGTMDGVDKRHFNVFLARQAFQVSRDMYVKYNNSRGALRTLRPMIRDYEKNGGGEIVLIGHSGGGVVAYGTAKMLHERGYPVDGVILVGSPELWIADDWQERVHSIRKAGRFGDPVTWWGRPCPGAPRCCETVDIVGGHPDYFRSEMKDASGISNLSKTMDGIWKWLRPKVGCELDKV